MRNKLTIRFAEFSDLSSIVDIYNQAIRTKCATGDTEEFNVEERAGWFEKYCENKFPLYVAEVEDVIVGYCSLSPYRPGRKAMSTIAEVSYYIDYSFHGNGIGIALLKHAISDCKRIGIETLLAILLDINFQSIGLLEKFKFVKWGHLPGIIKIDNIICGHLIYGLKLNDNT